jgi:excisionase family DNA binding protein
MDTADKEQQNMSHFSSSQPLLSISDVARLFSVSRQTIVNWSKAGKLRNFKLGGNVRFRVEDVDAFIAANERERAAIA